MNAAISYTRTLRADGKYDVKPTNPPFNDLEDAGEKMASQLISCYGDRLKGAVVIGCVRGGLPGARIIAERIKEYLQAKGFGEHEFPLLDMVIIRKFDLPEDVLKRPGLSIGALTETGQVQYLESFAKDRQIDLCSPNIKPQLDEKIQVQREELARRIALYRQGKAPLSLEGKLAIFFDDGMANGTTMKAALGSRTIEQGNVIVAVPVCSQVGLDRLINEAGMQKANICFLERIPLQKTDYWDCSDFYTTIRDVNDDEVLAIMGTAKPPNIPLRSSL